jgi:hypothetical protein
MISVANWPIVRPYNSKGRIKSRVPDKVAANFLADFVQKRPKRGLSLKN